MSIVRLGFAKSTGSVSSGASSCVPFDKGNANRARGEISWLWPCTLLVMSLAAQAEAPSQAERIQVLGFAAGPSILEARKGDATVWIVPIHSPLRQGQEWAHDELLAKLKASRSLVAPPRVGVSTSGIGFFRGLSAGVQAVGLKFLPQGKKLADVLEPGTAARWESMRDRHIPSATSQSEELDKLRPLFAAQRLFDDWTSTNGLAVGLPAWKRIESIARASGVSVVRADATLPLPAGNQGSVATQINKEEVDCLVLTLDLVEAGAERAIEDSVRWSNGSLPLTSAALSTKRQVTCETASRLLWGPGGAQWARDARKRSQDTWISAVTKELERNAAVVAVVGYRELYPGGIVEALQGQGYQVAAPN